MILATARAAEMAAYSEQLLAPYVGRIEAQAERIGRLELELEQARAEVAELRIPPTPQTPQDAAPEVERRSWWQRFVWG